MKLTWPMLYPENSVYELNGVVLKEIACEAFVSIEGR